MTLESLWIPLAVLLLWMPAAAVCPRAVKDKLRQASRRHHDGLKSLLRSPVNWFDLARALGGAWLLERALLQVPAGQEEMARVFLVLYMAVLVVGVLAQCFLVGQPFRIIGPVFYLTGLTLMVSGSKVGGFATVLGLTCALMFRRLSLYFLFLPAFLGLFGRAFGQLGLPLIVNAAAAGSPIFLAFAFGRRLAFVRRPAGESPTPPSYEDEPVSASPSSERDGTPALDSKPAAENA